MIPIDSRRKLVRRRNALYKHLLSVLQHASPQQVEDVMRKVHIINHRLESYIKREVEPQEVFNDNEENVTNLLS